MLEGLAWIDATYQGVYCITFALRTERTRESSAIKGRERR